MQSFWQDLSYSARTRLKQPGFTVIAVVTLGAAGVTQWMRGLLFGIDAADPLTFGLTAALLAGVALVACWLPARRAAQVDPLVALRYE